MSLLKDLATTIRDDLNSGGTPFAAPFQASVIMTPKDDADDSNGLAVVVFSVGMTRTRKTRRIDQLDINVNVAISQTILSDSYEGDELTDRLITLVEEIHDHILGKSYMTNGGVKFDCLTATVKIFDPKLMQDSGLFQGLINCTLTGTK